MPQKYALFPDKTVLDNITFGPEVSEFRLWRRWTSGFRRRRIELRRQALDYLRQIGLCEADQRKYPDQLSGGMQQRVAIARALAKGSSEQGSRVRLDVRISDSSTEHEISQLAHHLESVSEQTNLVQAVSTT